MRICVYGASSNEIDAKYISAGEDFGRAMAKAGHGMVFGGGANGMMGAAARGVTDCSGEIIGVIGHTGSGKSTLVQHLNGLLRPSSGRIFIDSI